jgi:hypothetical protein
MPTAPSVTITWDNGQVTSVHHGDIARNSASGDKDVYCAMAAVISPDRIHLREAALFAGALLGS